MLAGMIPDAPRLTSYAPVSATTNFDVGFAIFSDEVDDLEVWHDGAIVAGWTLSATFVDGRSADAQVVFSPGITGDVKIVGSRQPRRQVDFDEGRGVPARDHNTALDILTASQRELHDRTGRTLMVPPGETVGALPAEAARAGRLMAFDANGDPIPDLATGVMETLHSETLAARDAAQTAETGAETAQTGAESALDEFTDLYLGAKATDPALDNDGNALQVGALYLNTTDGSLRTWNGATWRAFGSQDSDKGRFTGDGVTTSFNIGHAIDVRQVLWVEDGITQEPDTGAGGDFTMSGTSVVRAQAPVNGAAIFWILLPGIGAKGDAGTAATVAAGAVTTLEPGQPVAVRNVGTLAAAEFEFDIPRGPQGSGESFNTKADAEASNLDVAPEAIRLFFLDSGQVPDSGGLYKRVVSEPSHVGKLSITLSDGVTVVWYELVPLNGWVHILQFGAPTDGSADASVAINNAIVYAQGVCNVFAPEGTYSIASQTVLLLDKTVLLGAGAQKTVFRWGAGGPTILVQDEAVDLNNTNIEFGRLTVDGVNEATVTRGVRLRASQFSQFPDLTIRNCTAVGAWGLFITGWEDALGVFRHALRNRFTNIRVMNCYHGIKFIRATNYPTHDGPGFNQFEFGHVSDFKGTGVFIDTGEGNRFYGLRNETQYDNTVAWEISDTVTSLIDCALDGIMFTSFVRIEAGVSGNVVSLVVAGVETLVNDVPFNTNLRTTAGDVVAEINANSATTGYSAELSATGADIHIFTAAGDRVVQGTAIFVGGSAGGGWDFMHSGPTDLNGGITGKDNSWGIPEGHAGSNAIGVRVNDTGSAVLINLQGNGQKDRVVYQSATARDNTIFIRGGTAFNLPVRLRRKAVADLPKTAQGAHEGMMMFCTNEIGGSIPVFHDGTNWRRVTDRAIAS